MVLTAMPFTLGKIKVITGPVGSDKISRINSFLDALVDSGYKKDSNVLVFRHPEDDPQPEQIGRHSVTVTDNVTNIYEGITSSTRTVIIVGAAHYQDKKIVDLAEAVVRSNRDLVLAGLNLDVQGKPYGFMPNLITLADEVLLSKANCSYPGCRSAEANRSIKLGDAFSAYCSHHYSHDCPPVSQDLAGSLKLYLGSMFSGKSTEWARELKKVEKTGRDPLVLNYLGDVRDGNNQRQLFGWGEVTLHSGERLDAVLVRTGEDIKKYLADNPGQKTIFINEGQFITGLYDAVFELIPKGYRFYVDALLRGFNRGKFNDIADLVCLANEVDFLYATCVQCGYPATENQRMKRIESVVVPADYHDPLEAVGGKDTGRVSYFYQARCLKDWVLANEPPLLYQLERFEWNK